MCQKNKAQQGMERKKKKEEENLSYINLNLLKIALIKTCTDIKYNKLKQT
jgi:hypothetical protein